MTNIELRPYQRDFIDAVRQQFLLNNRRVVGVAPCGAGKTIMTGWMIKEALARGKKSIFFVHRHELIRQTSETFTRLDIPHGIINAKVPMQLDLPVQIASVQTLARRLQKIPAPDFLICDECHHILANTYLNVINAFPNAFLLGVTATPERLNGITLCDAFDSMVESLSVNELISLGNLSPFKYFAPTTEIDLSHVRSKFGDFVNDDLAVAMSNKKIIGNIVSTYQRIADGKSAICYCVNVNHSKSVAQSFQAAGIPAAHCDGETNDFLRETIVNDFRRGKIKVLCNAELFGEGFDVPNCQAVILARPTKSLTLFIQQAMRSMRPDPNDPNKVALIIDHVKNYLRHGLPNEHHNWSLEPNPPQRTIPDTKECPKCLCIISRSDRVCPACGYEFKGNYSAPDTTEYSGTINEISTEQTVTRNDHFPLIKQKPTRPEDFLVIAKEKSYKIGWVAIQSVNYAQSYEDCLHIAKICGYNPCWAWHAWQKINSPENKKGLAKQGSFVV